MAAEMGEGHYYPDLLARMAQFELTLLDWADAHKGNKKAVYKRQLQRNGPWDRLVNLRVGVKKILWE